MSDEEMAENPRLTAFREYRANKDAAPALPDSRLNHKQNCPCHNTVAGGCTQACQFCICNSGEPEQPVTPPDAKDALIGQLTELVREYRKQCKVGMLTDCDLCIKADQLLKEQP